MQKNCRITKKTRKVINNRSWPDVLFVTLIYYQTHSCMGSCIVKQPDFQTLGGSFCAQNVYVLDFLAWAADNSEPPASCISY